MGKRPIQGARWATDCNVSGYAEFLDMISDSILQPTFKKLAVPSSGCSTKKSS